MSGLNWIREKTEYEKRSKVKLPDLIDKLANEAMPLIEFYLVECSEEKDAGLKDVVQTLEHALGFLQDLAALHDGSIDFRQ